MAPEVAAPSLMPLADVAIRLFATPFPTASDPLTGSVALVISVVAPGSEGVKPQRVAVSYSALDMNGHERAAEQREFAVTPQAGSGGQLAVNMQALAHLPPGRYDIVVRTRVVETGRQGELFADLTVPDYRKSTLSLSGVLIEEDPPPVALPAGALREVLERVPTTERTFAQNGTVSAVIRVYPGANSSENVVLKAIILDGKDRTVFDASAKIDVSNLPNRFAEHRLPLPLASLVPGPYLLRFETGRSPSDLQRREVRFEVR